MNVIKIYKTKTKNIEVAVSFNKGTIWLNLKQIADLFGIHKSGVSRHINNIYKTKELNRKQTVAKIATIQIEGNKEVERDIDYFNLDVIVSVGYRINSKKATQFRIWATDVLKRYLNGYAINDKKLLQTKERFLELQQMISFLEDKSKKQSLKDQSQEIISLLSYYSKALSLLDDYDKNKLKAIGKEKTKFVLEYKDCKDIVSLLKKEISQGTNIGLFGQERQEAFEGIINSIYQTFGGEELYSSITAKASHLFYFLIKDHPFTDGNKRIASFIFVYFLDKCNYLYRANGEKKINDNTLTALALLVAESNPKEKDLMINLIQNLIFSKE